MQKAQYRQAVYFFTMMSTAVTYVLMSNLVLEFTKLLYSEHI